MTTKRKYELKKRAEQMGETRLRITEAAIELHGSVGPSRTTMSAVAERAGVEPDERLELALDELSAYYERT